MHYQPEATSLPLGQYFIEQSNAINTLRMALPNNFKIYIKEHPYHYTQPIDPRFRPPNYHELINQIENVEFIDPMYPSFDLIDQARFVATLNGKVAFQALLRGKPAVCFGLNAYKDHEGCHYYKNQESLKTFINEVEKINFENTTDNFILNLKNKCVSGYKYLDGKLPEIENSIYWKAKRVATMKMFECLFKI